MSIRQWASRACTMDLRPSYGRKTDQLKDTLHRPFHENLSKPKFEDMVLYSRTRRKSWAERGSHSIEQIMVYDRKTEFMKNLKKTNDFGPRGTRDPRGPHKIDFFLIEEALRLGAADLSGMGSSWALLG